MNALKLVIPLFVALTYGPAQAVPILGSDLASFAVLGATPNVTNTGATTLTGDIGVSPAASITGLITITVDGTNGATLGNPNVHLNDAVAISGQSQLTTARNNLALLGPGTLLGANLTGLTLAPGVYTVQAGTTNLSGTLTLDGLGNANAFWAFQMPSTLITSTGSVVNVINTGPGAGVFWNVGSSATLNSGSTFEGNILALTSITMGAGVTISCGRALADTGTVTMINDTISTGCLGTGEEGSNGLSGSGLVVTIPPGGGGPVVTPIPEPEIYAMMAVGLGLLGWVGRRKKLKEAAAA